MLKGVTYFPKWLSMDVRRLIQRIVDPNPETRITIDEIKSNHWFREGYIPAIINDDDDEDDEGDSKKVRSGNS